MSTHTPAAPSERLRFFDVLDCLDDLLEDAEQQRLALIEQLRGRDAEPAAKDLARASLDEDYFE